MKYSPICYFAFNRPEHTEQTLAALTASYDAQNSPLFIFVDGPSNDSDCQAVEEVRRIVRTVKGFATVNLKLQTENLGTVQSIIPSVTAVLKDFDRVIVVEDDVVVSRNFIRFMNRSLEFYQENAKVMAVSGYMFRTPDEDQLPEAFFYRKGSSIGWGTWARAWRSLSLDCLDLLRQLDEKQLLSYLDGDGDFKISDILKRDSHKSMDDPRCSWSPRWFGSMVLAGGLTLYPRRSLVKNIGFDGSGIRSPVSKAWDVELDDFEPLSFPSLTEEHPLAHKIISEAYRRVDASR